jgi:hypothetical protein
MVKQGLYQAATPKGPKTMNLAQDIREAYHALDLMPGASWAEVKAAYRRLARALHPDLNPGRQGSDMAQVNRAYQRLNDFLAQAAQGDQAADGYRAYQFESWAPRQGQRPYQYESFRSQRPHSARPAAQPSQPAPSAARPASTTRTAFYPTPYPTPLAPVTPLAAARPQAPAQPPDAWRLRGLRREGQALVYQVEISGHPGQLQLPVRARRECAACSGSGRRQGQRTQGLCPVCAGRGHLTSSRMLPVDLPTRWIPGQLLSLPSQEGQENILVELLSMGGRA